MSADVLFFHPNHGGAPIELPRKSDLVPPVAEEYAKKIMALGFIEGDDDADPAPEPTPSAPATSNGLAVEVETYKSTLTLRNAAGEVVAPSSTTATAPKPMPVVDNTDPLALPLAALYGYAGRIALAADAPIGWAYCSALTMFGGIGVNVQSDASEPLPPRLYTALLSDIHYGKSRTIDRIRKLIVTSRQDFIRETNLNSDRALDAEFGWDEKQDGPPPPNPENWAPNYLVLSDEMLTLVRKLQIQGSALAPSLCSLYYRPQGSNSDRKGSHRFFVKLSYLGALKCKDPDDFKQTWQSNTGEGFADRCLIVPGPPTPPLYNDDWVAHIPEFDPDPRFADDDIASMPWERPLQTTVHVKLHVFDQITEWQRAGEGRERVAEIAKRCAIISAAVNNDTEITPECIDAALELCKWQERVRRIYSPSEAQGPDAVITNSILDAFAVETHKLMTSGAEKPYWVEFRKLSLAKNWSRKWGSAVTRAWKHLVTDGLMEQEMEEDGNGVRRAASPIRLRLAYKV